MMRLQNLLASPTDPKADKATDLSTAKVAEALQKLRASSAAQGSGVDVATATRGRSTELAELRQSMLKSAQQDTAIAGADVALEGLGKQLGTMQAMRDVASEATGAQFGGVFAAGKGLAAKFQALSTQLDDTAQATRLGGLRLADGSQPSLDAPLGDQQTASVALPATTAKALGLADLKLASQEDAKAAVKALDTAMAKLDAGQKGVFQFREGVSQVAETQRRDRFNSGVLRTREEALAMADQVSRMLPQDSGNGASYASQMLAKSVPSSQSVLSLLRGE